MSNIPHKIYLLFIGFVNWILNFLKIGKKKSNLIADDNASLPTEEDIKRQPGLKCPECGSIIPISMNQLLQMQTVVCNNCFLTLDIVPEKSKGALEALGKLKDGFDHAEAVKNSAVQK